MIERASGVTHASLTLLLAAASTAAISVICHTRMHLLSQITLCFSLLFTLLALLKLANAVADHFPKPIKTTIHWGHALVFELFAVLLTIPALKLIRLSKKYSLPTRSNATDATPQKPILLVHGYHKDSTIWFWLRRTMAKQNMGPIYVINLGNIFTSIRSHAEKVEELCAKIRLETGALGIILIGHSMGGLVASLCALESKHVTDVITIASPLSGTHMANIGLGPCAKEMRIDSDLTRELTKKIHLEKRVNFFHIGTKTDQLVIPSSSSLPGSHPDREFLFEDIGHASLLFSPRVAKLLTHWIFKISI